MPLPLEGLKVVDFATVYAGPNSAMMLADQGADVIKIESPDSRTEDMAPGGRPNLPFLAFNRNKRSIALDITKPAGRDAAYRLLQWADVVIINMRTSTRERRGFTYEAVSKLNPRLIYLSLTGYGDRGPEAHLPGADITLQARIGDIDERMLPGQPPPPHTQLFHFDMGTSTINCFSVMLALKEREQTGRGQQIETSLLATGLAMHACQMTRVPDVPRFGGPIVGLPQSYMCGDGRWILSQHINIQRRWSELCEALALPELTDDPRFQTLPGREAHVDEIAVILQKNFLTKPAAEWEQILKGHEHMMSMVRSIDEVFEDPQVLANDMLLRYDQPGVGEVIGLTPPFRLESTEGTQWIRRPVPRIGEHTDEVLRECAYSDAEIAALRSEQVVL